jgi:hypothetical protein
MSKDTDIFESKKEKKNERKQERFKKSIVKH